jgi:hypothetical protein
MRPSWIPAPVLSRSRKTLNPREYPQLANDEFAPITRQ